LRIASVVGPLGEFKSSPATSTLAINGGAAKAITKNATTALAGGETNLNQIVQVIYDGTQWQLLSQ
jgi:hypothetical protein